MAWSQDIRVTHWARQGQVYPRGRHPTQPACHCRPQGRRGFKITRLKRLVDCRRCQAILVRLPK